MFPGKRHIMQNASKPNSRRATGQFFLFQAGRSNGKEHWEWAKDPIHALVQTIHIHHFYHQHSFLIHKRPRFPLIYTGQLHICPENYFEKSA